MLKSKSIMLTIAVILLILLASLFLWQYAGKRSQQTHAPQKAVTINIPAGASGNSIAKLLVEHDVISSALDFRLALRLQTTTQQKNLRSGEYLFERPASVMDVIRRLQKGDIIHHQFTIPEGLRTAQVLDLLAKKSDLPRLQWQSALNEILEKHEAEGTLLPETYRWDKPLIPSKLLRQMHIAQQKIIHAIEQLDKIKSPLTSQQLRVAASIIEKETALDSERPLVAAVIRNRLQKNMPLQMDPTVIYGLWRMDGSFDGNIRRRDLRRDTKWNTYTRKGLPPTPICNPGKASLQAAAQPADVDYLYFVANGSGGHVFARTLGDHQRNVRKWLKLGK
ncbi:MAG: endolytic transglycosylase MltG [Mariprofundales bacterium]